MEIRSFLAFELPEEIKGIISGVSGDLKKSALNIRWVKVSNIHLTIIFMGNMSPLVLEQMVRPISDACLGYGPFDIALKGMGVFSSRRNPRVLWVGLDGHMERLANFRDTLQSCLSPFGIKKEKRPFNPHLTLGRFRKGPKPGARLDDLLTEYENLTGPVCPLRELVLFKSDLKPGGAIYTKLKIWPLTGDKSGV